MTSDNNGNCKAKVTVLHLIDTTGPGGAETVFIQLADLMRIQGYRSVVVIRGPGWVYDQLLERGIQPVVLDAKGSFNIKFLLSLVALIRKERVSLIHSHLLGSNVYAAIAGLLTRIPVVATYHGMVDVAANERFRRIKHTVMRWGIKHYVVVSNGLLSNIRDQGLLDPSRSSVVYNGIDTDKYGLSGSSAIKEELNLPNDTVLVGSLGNIRPAKGYDLLIAAAAQVVQKVPKAHFIIAGDKKASLMNELEALVERLNIAEHIHFLGFRHDSAKMLSQMDMFLLSSSSEGFSISTVEAMATGLPVLVTRCGGPEEIITHNASGWMVPVGEPDALAEGLIELMSNKVMSSRIAKAGRMRAVDNFGLQQMIDGYDKIYRNLTA